MVIFYVNGLNVMAVVLDNGAYSAKVGYSTDEDPRFGYIVIMVLNTCICIINIVAYMYMLALVASEIVSVRGALFKH